MNTHHGPCRFTIPAPAQNFVLALACFAAWLALCAGPALAEDITYPGASLKNPNSIGLASGLNAVLPSALSDNTVTVNSGGTAPTYVLGGGTATAGANVTNNLVTMNSGASATTIYGGYSNNDGEVSGNRVVMESGSASTNSVFGGWGSMGAVTGNSVTLTDATVNMYVYGGRTGFGSNSATGNSVTINGTSTMMNAYGGYSTNANAGSNRVTLNNGSVSALYGGYSESTTAGDGANNNVVVINGGTVGLAVYGGYSKYSSGSATGNTVTLSGTPNLSAATIWGGGGAGSTSDRITGNTLVADGVRNLSVSTLGNFQNYTFILPHSMAGQTMITVTGAAVTMGGTTVSITGMKGGGTPLQVGDSVILISKVSGTPTATSGTNIPYGISLLYDFDILAAGGQLTATVSNISGIAGPGDPDSPGGGGRLNPRVKALSEGRAASLAFVNQGADLLAGDGLRAALAASIAPDATFATFAAAGGGWSRYHTGSHVDVSGVSIIAGLAWKPRVGYGALAFGPFFEAGWGSYNTYNSFSNAASVKGNGDTSYYGGGLFARHDLPCGAYAEASGRVGGVRTDYSSSDLRDPVTGRKADYDKTRPYYGAHAGLGYVWAINESMSLDLYAKYFWTHQEGFSATVAEDRFTFKDSDSQRLRGGTRFAWTPDKRISPYVGAAYEYEFDGRARASTYDRGIDAPRLKGGTGMAELGLSLRPVENGPVSFDLGVQGYTGKREGVTGSLQFKLEF